MGGQDFVSGKGCVDLPKKRNETVSNIGAIAPITGQVGGEERFLIEETRNDSDQHRRESSEAPQ
jgi:hypothetical protein